MPARPEQPPAGPQREAEPSVTISEVEYRPEAADLLAGFELEAPQPATTPGYAIDFAGHLVLRESTASGIVLEAASGATWGLAFNEHRRELSKRYPEAPWAFWNCFRFSIGALRLSRAFEIGVFARQKGDLVGPFATIRGSRTRLPVQPDARFHPLMLTTMGRTGATWLTHVLGEHPSIAALEPFRYEGRVASYWLEATAALSEPMSFLQALKATEWNTGWWLGQVQSLRPHVDAELEGWLCTTHVEQLLSTMTQRVDALYEEAMRIKGRPGVTRFVEKCWPESHWQEALSEIYPRASEVFLVRDFRDMLASMLAYGAKERRQLFGRDRAQGPEDFASELRDSVQGMLEAWKRRSDVALLVTYEELIRSPLETLTLVLDHCGLDADPSTVEGMLSRAREKARAGQEYHRTSASAEESIGRWRRDLDPSVVRACEAEFGAALEAFGYR